jgi:GntR family transcriptional regulator
MQLHISTQGGKPIYLQIIEQVKHLLAAGRLKPDDELPPVRVLAQQLLINPNTVARAYRELETAGLVYKRQGAGTYIADGGSPLARSARRRLLADRVDALLVESMQMNFSVDDIHQLIDERHARLQKQREEQGK